MTVDFWNMTDEEVRDYVYENGFIPNNFSGVNGNMEV